MSSKKVNVQYFPFCPGIPWFVKNGRYILPQLDKVSWDRALKGRDAVILAYGGLLESFFSLSILEAVHKLEPSKKLYWCGNDIFNQLSYWNGLASSIDKPLVDESIVEKYPIPVFLDKDKFTYFNCLNNYIDVSAYYGKFGYHNKTPLFKQIFEKSCLDWNNNYPVLRNLDEPFEFNKFKTSNKFDFNKPFVFLAPDSTGWSEHNISCLDWGIQEIKGFIAMLQPLGINVVIMSPNFKRYEGLKALSLEPRLDYLLWTLPKAKVILSKDIDLLLMGLVISKARIVGLDRKDEYSLKSNKKFLNSNNELILFKSITPFEVFNCIK